MHKQLSTLFAIFCLFSTAHAGNILFKTNASGTLTSVTLDTSFTLTSDLSYKTVQIRILDAYPSAFNTFSSSNLGGGFTLSVSGGPTYSLQQDIGLNCQAIPTDGGNGNYDILILLTNANKATMTLTSGQTVTISGTANVTTGGDPSFITPLDNNYTAYLASGANGSRLTGLVTENVSTVPEPSTYAALAGLGALALAFLRRRKA